MKKRSKVLKLFERNENGRSYWKNSSIFSEKSILMWRFPFSDGNNFSLTQDLLFFFLPMAPRQDEGRLQRALDDMWATIDEDSSKCNINSIAVMHDVSYTTLRRYKMNGDRMVLKLGRNLALPEEYESTLAKTILDSPAGINGWTKEMVIGGARLTWQSYSKEKSDSKKMPHFSETWLDGFCRRHRISPKCPVKLSKARFEAVDRFQLMSFIAIVENFVVQRQIPVENVWTCDETTSIPRGAVTSKLFSAKGKKLFDNSVSIKVPKFSLLCCVNAAGDYLAPKILVPSKSASRREACVPIIGPSGTLNDWEPIFTSTGCMTAAVFSDWLLQTFAKKIRSKQENDSWAVLLIDNCASHFDEEVLQELHKQKIAVIYFLPNVTHVGSPLDVSVYGPFKRRLLDSLSSFNSLSWSNIGSWIEPAFLRTFIPKTIKTGFQATGLWNYELKSPDFIHVSSQYQQLLEDLPTSFSKLNNEARRSKLLKMNEERLNSLFEVERLKIGQKNRVVGGPSFFNRALAGNVATPLHLFQIHELQDKLAQESRSKEEQSKKAKKSEKDKFERKLDRERAIFHEKLEETKNEIRELKKISNDDKKKLKQAKNRLEAVEKTLLMTEKSLDVVLSHVKLNETSAESIFESAAKKSIPKSILGKRRAFLDIKRNAQRKRR
jgi:hypothetical protein